jgi:pyruvate,water dikinase
LLEAGDRLALALAHHSICSMIAVGLLDQTTSLAERAGHPELETVLNTGHGGLEEAQFVGDLWALSRGRTTLDAVLSDHGFHGPGELALPSYRMVPGQLRQIADRYRELPDGDAPLRVAERQQARREAAGRDIVQSLPAVRRSGARLILRLARKGIPLRETSKACFVMALDAARAAASDRFLELSARGFLDVPDDVFFLTLDELTGPERDFRDLVAERRFGYLEHQRLELPRAWRGQPVPAAGEAKGPAVQRLEGIPVCAGVIDGLVRVATTVGEAVQAEPGEVLVCHTTDPSWASVFPLVGGLAIDVGSAASHGAIVARELGLPCVINTGTGTETFVTGDLVRLDGAAGTIELLDGTSPR